MNRSLYAVCLALLVVGCSPDSNVPPAPDLGTPAAQCGNGLLETGEACDDGNTVDTDGLGDDIVYGVYAVGSTVYAATFGGGLSISQ